MNLRDLLIDQLHDLHSAETQLLDALPEMASASTGENLKQAFLDHLEETKHHVARIERALSVLRLTPKGKTCAAMQGLIAEGNEAIDLKSSGAIRDVALVGAARRVEHYEIAAYKAARGIANAVDEQIVGDLLQQTLDEETKSELRLSTLADLEFEAAKDLDTASEAPAKTSVRKLGKKKQK